MDAFQQLEELIRTGKTGPGRRLLKQLALRNPPRRDRVKLARFARRLSYSELGLRLLRRLVRPPNGVPCQATEEERLEYGAHLLRVGASRESLGILETIDPRLYPEASLLRAFALFSQWEYRASIPVLRDYVELSDLTPYQRAVGRANLAAALVYERMDEARGFVDGLLKLCREKGYDLLIIHLLMMEAEDAIFHAQWDWADRHLAQARERLDAPDTLDALFVRKWGAIRELYHRKEVHALETVRTEALRLKHWETLRNCDYHQAVALGDPVLVNKVYFGTSFSSLKERLVRESGIEPDQAKDYRWVPSGVSGTLQCTPFQGLKAGSASFRLLGLLCGDFYLPIRVATLYSELYPGEFFNPDSSPGRVHQAVKRLRRRLHKAKQPLEIDEHDGFYRMKAEPGMAIVLPVGTAPSLERGAARTERLRGAFEAKGFSAKEAGDVLGVSVWTAIRVLRQACFEGELLREGKGKQTRYRFAPPAVRVAV